MLSLRVVALAFAVLVPAQGLCDQKSEVQTAAIKSRDVSHVEQVRLNYFGTGTHPICKSRGVWIHSSHCYKDGACCQNGDTCKNAYEALCELVTCAGGVLVKHYCDQDPD